MKNRVLTMLLTAVVAVSAAGCGTTTSDPANGTAGKVQEPQATEAEQADPATGEQVGDQTAADTTSTGPKILHAATS